VGQKITTISRWPRDEDLVRLLSGLCLKITDLDPLEYDLLFERFLNS